MNVSHPFLTDITYIFMDDTDLYVAKSYAKKGNLTKFMEKNEEISDDTARIIVA